MKIREPIRLGIMYSDRLAINQGRHSYISAWHSKGFFFFFLLQKTKTNVVTRES